MKNNLFVLLVLIYSAAVFAVDNSKMLADQKERYTSIFNSADKNQDEVLSIEEARFAGLSTASFALLDADQDQSLNLDEFLSMASRKGSERTDG